jgi:hypothetical protein
MASNYVNNEDFMAALVAYKKDLETNPNARVPEYIGKCILDIAERFSTKPNFYGYSYRDEMVSDAVENCLMYLANYDPGKGKNPFAYFTQICFFAFLRRIHREKKQSYIKHRLIQDLPFESFDLQDHDDSELATSFVAYVQSHSSFDSSAFEKSLVKKPKKKDQPRTALDDLIGDDNGSEEV